MLIPLNSSVPNGITLTLIAVAVVFGSLILLYLCYSLIGALSTGSFKPRRKAGKKARGKAGRKGGTPDAETAAAIALALRMHNGHETEAAIALALHCHLSETVHDKESYIITIRRK